MVNMNVGNNQRLNRVKAKFNLMLGKGVSLLAFALKKPAVDQNMIVFVRDKSMATASNAGDSAMMLKFRKLKLRNRSTVIHYLHSLVVTFLLYHSASSIGVEAHSCSL